MASSNAVQLQEYTRKKEIIRLTLEGKHPSVIAQEMNCSESTIKAVIKAALDEARLHFINDADSLLVRNYLRAENLIEDLTSIAITRDENGAVTTVDYKGIDRIDKLMNTQIKLLTLDAAKTKMPDGEAGEGGVVDNVFSTSSRLYERAIEMASENQDFEFTDGQILFEEIEKQIEEKGLIGVMSSGESVDNFLDDEI